MTNYVTFSEKPFSPDLGVLGFSVNLTGGHMARSMMLDELTSLCAALPVEASKQDYRGQIEDENLFGKQTVSSRRKTYSSLVQLYGLDPALPLFRVLRRLALEDPASTPLMGMVCAYCRDAQLRYSFALIEALKAGEILPRERMEGHFETGYPKRFSKVMKESLSQHVNTTWTVTGHLSGRAVKRRSIPSPRVLASVYAMFAGWLAGLRGQVLLQSVFSKLVAAEPQLIVTHLAEASARGWLRLRNAGGVTEIDFSSMLTELELSLIHVQD